MIKYLLFSLRINAENEYSLIVHENEVCRDEKCQPKCLLWWRLSTPWTRPSKGLSYIAQHCAQRQKAADHHSIQRQNGNSPYNARSISINWNTQTRQTSCPKWNILIHSYNYEMPYQLLKFKLCHYFSSEKLYYINSTYKLTNLQKEQTYKFCTAKAMFLCQSLCTDEYSMKYCLGLCLIE